ncbi:MAG: hypothetical protein PUC44_00295 [Eubacteriales bacterium]|nr:hypothetical protein [Eubacteriales bacterium]
MSEYDPLWRYIQVNAEPHEIIDFDKAEEVSDVRIEPSFQEHTKELIEYGFKVERISWKHRWFEIRML